MGAVEYGRRGMTTVRVLADGGAWTPARPGYICRKITDKAIRRRWEAATKVNINGERVTLDPDGPMAQAQWAKTCYGMATQTLSNGYCGLPVQRSAHTPTPASLN